MKDVAKKEAELEEAMIKAAAEHEAEEANAEAEKAEQEAIDIEPKTEIEYDDFAKMQFQVGEIISCEAVPKSKKLAVQPGEDRQSGTSDRLWHQRHITARRKWWAKGYGTGEPEACETGRSIVRGHDPVRRRRGRQSGFGHPGEEYACRSRDLLNKY